MRAESGAGATRGCRAVAAGRGASGVQRQGCQGNRKIKRKGGKTNMPLQQKIRNARILPTNVYEVENVKIAKYT